MKCYKADWSVGEEVSRNGKLRLSRGDLRRVCVYLLAKSSLAAVSHFSTNCTCIHFRKGNGPKLPFQLMDYETNSYWMLSSIDQVQMRSQLGLQYGDIFHCRYEYWI